jgi:small-conductance mechanosensitive channel
MDRFLELLRDTESIPGRLVTTLAVVAVAIVVAPVVGRLVGSRFSDPSSRYYARKFARYAVGAVTLVVLAVVWRAFAGRLGVVFGLAAAGVAFAMQEVIGALAGWLNILSGGIFRVGDRIQMAGVRGDVIDITPLRTKVMEIGSADDATWVKGRQYTGRIVAISNKATFTEPVFNYSSSFEFIWEELTLPVPYDADWRQAEDILRDEVDRASASEGARAAIDAMMARYPVARTEVEPRVFVRATDNWNELSARFIVPVRSARLVKDRLTRRVLDRFSAAGIRIASETSEVTLHVDERPGRREAERH